MNGQVLVVYASKHGSTAGIAEVLGDALRAHGLVTDVRPAKEVRRIDDYGTVVVGSAVYMFRWQGDAIDFLKRFRHELQSRPTWLFSSGPTGGTTEDDAKVAEILATQPPLSSNAAKLAEQIGVRGHRTFGGRTGDEMKGFFERWIPKGDWRDFDAVHAWADEIARSAPVNVG